MLKHVTFISHKNAPPTDAEWTRLNTSRKLLIAAITEEKTNWKSTTGIGNQFIRVGSDAGNISQNWPHWLQIGHA